MKINEKQNRKEERETGEQCSEGGKEGRRERGRGGRKTNDEVIEKRRISGSKGERKRGMEKVKVMEGRNELGSQGDTIAAPYFHILAWQREGKRGLGREKRQGRETVMEE